MINSDENGSPLDMAKEYTLEELIEMGRKGKLPKVEHPQELAIEGPSPLGLTSYDDDPVCIVIQQVESVIASLGENCKYPDIRAKFSMRQRVIWLTNELECFVCNGGFVMYFDYVEREKLIPTIEAYKLIGADYAAKLVCQAARLLLHDEDILHSLDAYCDSTFVSDDGMNDVEQALDGVESQFFELMPPDGLHQNKINFIGNCAQT